MSQRYPAGQYKDMKVPDLLLQQEKMDAIDENELTEEALYYAEVNLRISQKLLEVQ